MSTGLLDENRKSYVAREIGWFYMVIMCVIQLSFGWYFKQNISLMLTPSDFIAVFIFSIIQKLPYVRMPGYAPEQQIYWIMVNKTEGVQMWSPNYLRCDLKYTHIFFYGVMFKYKTFCNSLH